MAEPSCFLSTNPTPGSLSKTTAKTDCLNTMRATKTDDLVTGVSKRLSNNIERQLPATTLSDAYPNNIVVQHMMPMTVPQFITSVSQTILLAKFADTHTSTGHYWQYSDSWSSRTSFAPYGANRMSAHPGSATWRMQSGWYCPR